MSKIAEKKVPPPHALGPGETCHLDQLETCPPVEGREKKIEGWDKKSAQKRISHNAKLMANLARRLYAENRRSILLVLQGMDTAGKDGTIRSVMRGINPRSCQVHSFKKPSELELDHDFLWRVHNVVPRKGNIGIFNRSHYEDVLIVRVLDLAPQSVWEPRFETINIFEKALTEGGMLIVKCYLHISNDTQRERLQARIDDPNAHWKFNPEDIEQRKRWPDYQQAYEDAITRCNTAHAPWYIVPSDRKWYRNLIVSELLLSKLQEIDPQYPVAERDWTGIVVS